ncbi:LysR family transcriptional regulator [Desulfogranum japonicum]|uniref:LysR family transcriptional regulator n=1 Tax=Desulfogranum japonicum TaxID=231447 RepID=UPI000491E11F|nr:LysR substrate-binding domain-containing protein [Desulfogranum japonicum]
MDTKQLKYFVAVAEELHFGRAAKRLNMSQPPLSQQIMKFEEELGVSLFQRNNRSVSLTPEGRLLLEEAKAILSSIDRARDHVRAVAAGKEGHLSLGYIGPALDTPLAEIIKEFKQTYPKVRFELMEMPTNVQLEAVQNGGIDAGVVRLFKHDTEGLVCIKYHEESYALALPSGHRLEHRKQIAIEELSQEDFIFFPRASQPHLYDEWMSIFSEYGVNPKIVQEAFTKAASLSLVAASIGIAIVPESIARRAPKQVRFKRLVGKQPRLEMHMVFKKNTHHPVREKLLSIIHKVTGYPYMGDNPA